MHFAGTETLLYKGNTGQCRSMHQNNKRKTFEAAGNKERVRVKGVKTKIALSIRPSKGVNQNACFLSGNIKGSQK